MNSMALGKDYAQQQCSIARALEVVGERWTLLVVRDAFYGVRRYNDFLVHLGAPRAVLAARLQALVEAGVLDRRRYRESPPRDEYVLTGRGLALWPVLRSLGAWGRAELPGAVPVRHFHHADCGTELGAYGECPACGSPSLPPMSRCGPAPGSTGTRRTPSAAPSWRLAGSSPLCSRGTSSRSRGASSRHPAASLRGRGARDETCRFLLGRGNFRIVPHVLSVRHRAAVREGVRR